MSRNFFAARTPDFTGIAAANFAKAFPGHHTRSHPTNRNAVAGSPLGMPALQQASEIVGPRRPAGLRAAVPGIYETATSIFPPYACLAPSASRMIEFRDARDMIWCVDPQALHAV